MPDDDGSLVYADEDVGEGEDIKRHKEGDVTAEDMENVKSAIDGETSLTGRKPFSLRMSDKYFICRLVEFFLVSLMSGLVVFALLVLLWGVYYGR